MNNATPPSSASGSPSLTIATDHPVLVTGATGYVAGWIVKRLVEAGVTVHAAVRDPHDAHKLAHLKAMSDAGPRKLAARFDRTRTITELVGVMDPVGVTR